MDLLTLWFDSWAAFLLLSKLYTVVIHMESKHDASRGKMIFSDESEYVEFGVLV